MVSTKYGNINTDHILFICSGAFHACKPSDMLAELQGRLPIRVELKGLTKEVCRDIIPPYSILFCFKFCNICINVFCEIQDLYRILTEPETNLIKQQIVLLKTEGVDLVFTNDAVRELANIAAEVYL